jgi:DNA-binding NtrC family response regulator
VVHRAFIMADQEISPRCLPREVGGDSGSVRSLHFQVGASIEDIERRLIMATLEAYGGNKRKTADVLGVSLKTLYNRLNTYREL